MSQYASILVVAHPQMQLTPALGRAACLAHMTGAEIRLCLFAYEPLIAHADSAELQRLAQKEFLDERERWLADRAASLREQGLRVSTEVIWAPLMYEALVAKVLERPTDMVIKDATNDYDMPRLLHSPQDWKLLRYCPSPLMLVAPGASSHPRRIAAAVDPLQNLSEPPALNQRIVSAARELGKICDAEVLLVSSFPLASTDSITIPQMARMLERSRQEHAKAFTALCDREGIAISARYCLQGPPAQELANFVAESHVDLLVLGSIYRTGFSRLLLGSTSEELLTRVHCDVLLIKPEGFLQQLEEHLDLVELRQRYVHPQAGDITRPEPLPV